MHVAPGLGNAMGALYTAKRYGSPVIVTAGQQPQGLGVTEPLLYDPLVPLAAPLVKWATEVTRVNDLPRILRRAAKVALSPPEGPVFISLPGDVLNDSAELELGRPTRLETATLPAAPVLERLAERLLAAASPLICTGHEVCTADALLELAEVARLLGAPVYHQSAPYSAQYPSEDPLFMGMLTRDQKRMRAVLEPADLLFSVGAALFALSLPSEVEPMPPGMPIIQLGLRDWEMGKNYPAEMAIHAEVKTTLAALIPLLREKRSAERARAAEEKFAQLAPDNWSARREKLQAEAEAAAGKKPIEPAFLVQRICAALPDDGILVDEGITTTGRLLDYLTVREKNRYWGLASGGLGFGLPGALGIKPGPARPAAAVRGGRRQRHVCPPGTVDRRAPQAADRLRDRQQRQLPHPQGSVGPVQGTGGGQRTIYRDGSFQPPDRLRPTGRIDGRARHYHRRSGATGPRPGPGAGPPRRPHPAGRENPRRLRRLSPAPPSRQP